MRVPTHKYSIELMALMTGQMNLKTAIEMANTFTVDYEDRAQRTLKEAALTLHDAAITLLNTLGLDTFTPISSLTIAGNAYIKLSYALNCLDMLTTQCDDQRKGAFLEGEDVIETVREQAINIRDTAVQLTKDIGTIAEDALST